MNTPMPWPDGIAIAQAMRAGAGRMLYAMRAAVRRTLARVRRNRRAAAMSAKLHALDAHALRDLGFHRSEIESVVAELTGDAEPTRERTQRARRHLQC